MQVRTCCAQLIGAYADSNSLKSTQLFEENLVSIIKDIGDDFNWEVRKEICGQLPFISKYIGAQKSYLNFYELLEELMDDEEREVIQTSIQAFSEITEFYLMQENDLEEKDQVREQMFIRFKHFISQSKYVDNENLSRFYIEQAFWIAILFDRPMDEDLISHLQSLIVAWRPGQKNKFMADEYER